MLWPFLFPFKITFWSIAALVGLVTIAAPVFGFRRGKAFINAFVVASVIFIPSCTAIMAVVDSKRFGMFEAATFSEIDDFRIERYLPPSSREISVEKQPAGFRARFKISKLDLSTWFDNFWTRYGEYSVSDRDDASDSSKSDAEYLQMEFVNLDWEYPSDMTVLEGPIARNGAGFTLWYDEETQTAFQRGHYW